MALILEGKAILPAETPPTLEEFSIANGSEMFKLVISRKSGTDTSKSVNVCTLSTYPSMAHSASMHPSLFGHDLSYIDI